AAALELARDVAEAKLLGHAETLRRVRGEARADRERDVGRIEVDEVAARRTMHDGLERPVLDRRAAEDVGAGAEVRFVADLGVRVVAERNVESVLRVDAIKAVVTGAV